MEKFKAGDRVEYVGVYAPSLRGARGTVASYTTSFTVEVRWDDWRGCVEVMPESLKKISERRVGWRVDYPRNGRAFNLHPNCLGSIFDTEESAKDMVRAWGGGDPVRIEYDVAVPSLSKTVRVGDKVRRTDWTYSGGVPPVGEVRAIVGDKAWVAFPVSDEVVETRNLILDESAGLNSYDQAARSAV